MWNVERTNENTNIRPRNFIECVWLCSRLVGHDDDNLAVSAYHICYVSEHTHTRSNQRTNTFAFYTSPSFITAYEYVCDVYA